MGGNGSRASSVVFTRDPRICHGSARYSKKTQVGVERLRLYGVHPCSVPVTIKIVTMEMIFLQIQECATSPTDVEATKAAAGFNVSSSCFKIFPVGGGHSWFDEHLPCCFDQPSDFYIALPRCCWSA